HIEARNDDRKIWVPVYSQKTRRQDLFFKFWDSILNFGSAWKDPWAANGLGRWFSQAVRKTEDPIRYFKPRYVVDLFTTHCCSALRTMLTSRSRRISSDHP